MSKTRSGIWAVSAKKPRKRWYFFKRVKCWPDPENLSEIGQQEQKTDFLHLYHRSNPNYSLSPRLDFFFTPFSILFPYLGGGSMRWVRNSKCYIRYYNRRWWYILIWGLYSISGSFCRKNDSHRIFFEESFGHKGRNVGHCPIDRLRLLPWRERGRTQNGTKNFRHRIFPLSVECKRKIIKRVFSSNKFFFPWKWHFCLFCVKACWKSGKSGIFASWDRSRHFVMCWILWSFDEFCRLVAFASRQFDDRHGRLQIQGQVEEIDSGSRISFYQVINWFLSILILKERVVTCCFWKILTGNFKI